jgi:hypothetical protein
MYISRCKDFLNLMDLPNTRIRLNFQQHSTFQKLQKVSTSDRTLTRYNQISIDLFHSCRYQICLINLKSYNPLSLQRVQQHLVLK